MGERKKRYGLVDGGQRFSGEIFPMSGKRIDTIAAAFLLLLDVAIGGILKGIDPILTADALQYVFFPL